MNNEKQFMKNRGTRIAFASFIMLAGIQFAGAGDLAVNNATVQGDLGLQAPGDLFNATVRYRISDDGSQTRLFADSDRALGSWWWRSLLNGTDSKTLMALEGGADQNSRLWLYDDSNAAPDIGLSAKGDSFFNTGRLGLGTTSPSQKLDVVGTIKTTGFQLTTAPAAGYVLTSDENGVGAWQELSAGGAGGGGGEPAGPAGGDLAGQYPNPALAVSESSLSKVSGNAMSSVGGNIGVGTSTPDSKLHVVGRAHFSDVLRLQPSSRPAAASSGDIYFDGDSLWIYNTKWRKFTIK